MSDVEKACLSLLFLCSVLRGGAAERGLVNLERQHFKRETQFVQYILRQIIQYGQHMVHEKYFLVSNNDNTKHCCDVNLIKNCEEGEP